MTRFVLETERLGLRRASMDDVAWITREIANENVHKWLTGPPHPFRASDCVEWIEKQNTDCGIFVIEVDVPLGVVGVETGLGDFDLGYWLSEKAWGKGIMTEAARAAVGWHFAQYDVALRSGYLPKNHGSRRILETLGFKRTELKQAFSPFYGHDVDVQKMALSKPDWILRNA